MKSDEKIKLEILDRFATDSRIDSRKIKVDVTNGNVILSGETSYYIDKIMAKEITWNVVGVNSVENNISVIYPNSVTIPTDKDIKSKIEDKLERNAFVDASQIDVEVESGTVELSGMVPTFWEKEQAEKDVSLILGVLDILNKLVVVPTISLSDQIIAENLMSRIEQTVPNVVDNINAKVSKGKVTLSGEVSSYKLYSDIYFTAQNTLGVSSVEDKLKINSEN